MQLLEFVFELAPTANICVLMMSQSPTPQNAVEMPLKHPTLDPEHMIRLI